MCVFCPCWVVRSTKLLKTAQLMVVDVLFGSSVSHWWPVPMHPWTPWVFLVTPVPVHDMEHILVLRVPSEASSSSGVTLLPSGGWLARVVFSESAWTFNSSSVLCPGTWRGWEWGATLSTLLLSPRSTHCCFSLLSAFESGGGSQVGGMLWFFPPSNIYILFLRWVS